MLGVLAVVVTKVLGYSLVLVLGLWCWFQWVNWNFLQAARRMPETLKSYPLIGHAYMLTGSWEDVTKMVIDISRTAVSKGLYNVCFWCGPMPIILIHKLEDVQKVLTTSCTSEKGDEMDYLKYATGNGLLTAPGSIWRVTRRYISPLFTRRNIEQLMTVFNNNSRELVADLAEHVDGEPVDTLHPVMSVALKSACQLIFGTELDFDRKSPVFEDAIEEIKKVTAIFTQRYLKPWLRIDSIFEFLYRKELKKTDEFTRRFSEAPLKVAKTNHANRTLSIDGTYGDLSHEVTLNLVDVYAKLQNDYPQFTKNDLKDEMSTLFSTGTDTVGLAVSSCLLVLGKHQDIQERLYEEINAIVGKDEDVREDHLGDMQYLDQVFKETLRWSMIVPYILRKTAQDLTLSTCTVPAGNTVVVSLVGPHMDPAIYPDPRKFDPERFSPQNATGRARHAFIPFSSGSRMCIAKNYAEHIVKTMLIHVLRRFRVSTDMDIDNLKKRIVITLANSEGYPIKFHDRK